MATFVAVPVAVAREIYVLWGIRPVAAMRAPYKIPTVRRHSMIC